MSSNPRGFINIRLNAKQLRRDLAELKGHSIPRAMSNVVNRLAYNSRLKIQDEMKVKFRNPTAWTLGMFAVIPARPGSASASIVTKDLTSSYKGGTAAARYLSPEVFGGERELKPSEKLLSSISEGQEWVPGRDAPLNSNGNIRLSEIVRILVDLGKLKAKPSRRSKGRKVIQTTGDYFVPRHAGTGRPLGIYKRTGRGKSYREILRFIPTHARYRPILPAQRIVDDLISRRARGYVQEEIEKFTQARFNGKN